MSCLSVIHIPKTKALWAVMLVAVVLSVGWGQSVPDTILLPDSLGPLRPPYHLAFGSSTDNIYVASESSDIMVVDGSFAGSFQRIRRVNTGTPVGAALLVSQHNKLYCPYPQQGRIGVIDCSTNTIVGSIQVGTRPTMLCYSSGSDKLYCGDTILGTVSVIDCATDRVLKVIPVGDSLAALEYDPTTNKAYAATQDAVRAISCSADSIVASIDEIKSARVLCINKRRQKLYAVARPCLDSVYVVSTTTDSVVARIRTYGYHQGVPPVLACNESTDRLYRMNAGGVADLFELDCVGDTLLRYRLVSDIYTSLGLMCDTLHNRLYYLCCSDAVGGDLFVLDCATLDIISRAWISAELLGVDQFRYRLLCVGGSRERRALSVFDHKGDSLSARGAAPLCGWMEFMFHNPATDKLYYWWSMGIGGVGVIDEETSRLVGQAFLSRVTFKDMTYNRTRNKVYFRRSGGGGLGVMDGSRDSLIRVIETGTIPALGMHLSWCPDEDKVYCGAVADLRRYISIVDCNTDSVVRELDVYDFVEGIEYLGGSRMLCVQNEHLTLIDSKTDSVLVDTAIEGNVGLSYSAAHTGDGEKVYMLRNNRLRVLSSSSLSLLATIDWTHAGYGGGGFLVYSEAIQQLYWFGEEDSVLAIDVVGDTIVARMATNVSHDRAVLDHTGRYVFCLSDSIRVYDMQSDSLVAVYGDFRDPVAIASSPEQHRIYVGCKDMILAYPDAPPGVEETTNAEVLATNRGPTVVHGVLFLPGDRGPGTGDRAALMDVSGRKVMDIRPGANDVRALAPGVYFVREETGARGEGLGKTRKIVLTE
jgi:DNA-binding beta-propeller fold protein YncE